MNTITPPRGDVGFFMVADWEKAVAIITRLLSKNKKIESVEMGLDGDWKHNSMVIWQGGEFTKYNCYDRSLWAEPILIVNYTEASSETFQVWSREEKQ